MLPNTFIIGAPKCGTTALASYLASHPEVYFSVPKEPLFWCQDLPAAKHELRPRTLEEYLLLFKEADPRRHKIVAEGSTAYLRSKVAVPRILEFSPDAKFIVMLRNPVDVVQAFHMEQCYNQNETETDFTKAWALQSEREQGRSMPNASIGRDDVLYRKIARFGEQVRFIKSHVLKNNIKYIFYEDFQADSRRVYTDVLEFLGLQDDGRDEFEPVNAAHSARIPLISRFILHPPAILERPMRSLRMYLIRNNYKYIKIVKNYLNKKSLRKPVSENLKQEISNYFLEDIKLLEDEIGRNLSMWTGAK
ncbi:sulfotransferase family protein [Polymorphum gilvum]|uniref:sulfotransferase family protein n=1 Tax=Polymorphum gilvum TaxID=991904 RepID=UPI000A0218E6|nr:sulfotransferase [Polymorphum gilvum]